MKKEKRSSFSGSIGFVLAAAGSAVGLGNIWRFPYLAAKNGGGAFLFVYIILALTFGFTLLTTEIALGRKTRQGPLTAYGLINKKFGFTGLLAWIVPIIILPYYCTIGGWVLKYLEIFIQSGTSLPASEGFFGGYIEGLYSPIIWFLIFLAITAFVVISGVEKGIEKYSRVIMPILIIMVLGISIFALTLKNTDASGATRTGLSGLKIYVIPDFSGMTPKGLATLVLDAVSQLFFSISVAMGIMVAYGSYVPDDTNLNRSINQIEIFDTVVALLAGLMIVPAVYVFSGREGMSEGPGLMFISLPKVFNEMGTIGRVLGIIFFIMVTFAAVTSSVSVMEAIVAGLMDKWKISRIKSAILTTVYAAIVGTAVCLGFNKLSFSLTLPNGTSGNMLDLLDYLSNKVLMPVVAIITCILFGWVAKPKTIIDEVKKGGAAFGREKLYIIMIKFVAPVLLILLLVQSFI